MEEGKGRRFPLNGRQKVQQVQLNSSSYYGRASIVVQGDEPRPSYDDTLPSVAAIPIPQNFKKIRPCRKVKIRPACVLAKKKTY